MDKLPEQSGCLLVELAKVRPGIKPGIGKTACDRCELGINVVPIPTDMVEIRLSPPEPVCEEVATDGGVSNTRFAVGTLLRSGQLL